MASGDFKQLAGHMNFASCSATMGGCAELKDMQCQIAYKHTCFNVFTYFIYLYMDSFVIIAGYTFT